MTHTKPLTERNIIIINNLQAQNWESVITVCAGLTKEQILILLVEINPARNTQELSGLIFWEMPRHLNSDQAAAISGLVAITIRKICHAGKIPGAIRVGYRWLIPATTARTLEKQPSMWDNTIQENSIASY